MRPACLPSTAPAPPQPRIHLVVDVAESPRQVQQLAPGQLCQYTHGGQLDCARLEGAAAAAAGVAEE